MFPKQYIKDQPIYRYSRGTSGGVTVSKLD